MNKSFSSIIRTVFLVSVVWLLQEIKANFKATFAFSSQSVKKTSIFKHLCQIATNKQTIYFITGYRLRKTKACTHDFARLNRSDNKGTIDFPSKLFHPHRGLIRNHYSLCKRESKCKNCWAMKLRAWCTQDFSFNHLLLKIILQCHCHYRFICHNIY